MASSGKMSCAVCLKDCEAEFYAICPQCMTDNRDCATILRALDVLVSLEEADIPTYTKRHVQYAVNYILGAKDEEEQGADVED